MFGLEAVIIGVVQRGDRVVDYFDMLVLVRIVLHVVKMNLDDLVPVPRGERNVFRRER